MSPTARSLEYLRKQGHLAQVVERWNAYARRRHDLFGFVDVVYVDDSRQGITGVQVTTTANLSNRMLKLRTECADAMVRWVNAGNRLLLHGWSKRGARGRRKTWVLTAYEVLEVSTEHGATLVRRMMQPRPPIPGGQPEEKTWVS